MPESKLPPGVPFPGGVEHPNPPALPGVGVRQKTKAERDAEEAKFNALKNITPEEALENFRIWLKSHPEWHDWIKASIGI